MGESLPPLALTKEAFELLMQAFQPRLEGFVRRIVGNGEDARDVVQSVFIAAWRMAERLAAPFIAGSAESAVRRWLFHVASNEAIDALRRRRVHLWESLDDPSSLPKLGLPREQQPFDERVALREALKAALAHLEPASVACVWLSSVEGFTSVEVGQMLDITPATARKRLSRAMRQLRAAYLAQCPPDPAERSPSSAAPPTRHADTPSEERREP